MGAKPSGGERVEPLSMPGAEQRDQDEPTQLDVVSRVEGDFRRQLASLTMTPLQAGVILYLHRQRRA